MLMSFALAGVAVKPADASFSQPRDAAVGQLTDDQQLIVRGRSIGRQPLPSGFLLKQSFAFYQSKPANSSN